MSCDLCFKGVALFAETENDKNESSCTAYSHILDAIVAR